MYYKICEYCGAYLDTGEKCDCDREYVTANRIIKKVIYPTPAAAQRRFRKSNSRNQGKFEEIN